MMAGCLIARRGLLALFISAVELGDSNAEGARQVSRSTVRSQSYLNSMDPERLVQCPYDKNHQIRACRLPYHLVKCRKNNQKIARELATCPYNARHRVPKQELKLHIATCENKVSPEVLEVTSSRGDPKNRIKEVTAWQCPPPEEDWEADAAECPAPPFVFGTSYSGERS
uniref:gametocyte-specific factor 1-like isoform X2 n=1 Tax=Podarcis muralis TaxID=64176 RepID=UPI0010A09CA4|nr:gametocyte-specific factor 1-like isoform X2 [Podarcis muralis]